MTTQVAHTDETITINGEIIASKRDWLMADGRTVNRWFPVSSGRYSVAQDAIIDCGTNAPGEELARVIETSLAAIESGYTPDGSQGVFVQMH